MAFSQLKRRQFISLVGGAAAWPLAVRAQQAERTRRIGALIAFPENDAFTQSGVAALSQGLRSLGWIEGKNIQVNYRFAGGDPILFKRYAAELVALSPDAIFAGATPAAKALSEVTHTIPIVFILVVDPVGLGLVDSLAHPGANITGFSAYDSPVMGKWLSLLKQVAPRVTRVTLLFNPDTSPFAKLFIGWIEAAAPSLGVAVIPTPVHDEPGLEAAFEALGDASESAVIALPDSFNNTHRNALISAAARHHLPLVAPQTVYTKAGALMSYGYDVADTYANAATYIDRILRGAKPADLPIQQPTKFYFAINLQTANALGLTVPSGVLAIADEVIE